MKLDNTLMSAYKMHLDSEITSTKLEDEMSQVSDTDRLSKLVLSMIFARRNVLNPDDAMSSDIAKLPQNEVQHHLRKIKHYIQNKQRIVMLLPAFPGKSPNRHKTLSNQPDLAEYLALDELGALCKEITKVYSHGVEIKICSDGYVFSDLVRIPDAEVNDYTNSIYEYTKQHFPEDWFSVYDLADSYEEIAELDSAREELLIEYGESIYSLKDKIKNNAGDLAMYRGITRFLFEDFTGLDSFQNTSKTQIQKLARQTAYRVIQRSNAWSDLIAKQFPDAVRLSIHPQMRESAKIGIKMIPNQDAWRTPWHSVAVKKGSEYFLVSRAHIDESESRLIFSNGRPFYYRES